MTDFLITTGIILALLPIFYFISGAPMNIFSFLVVFALLYPTLRALINGAPFVPTPMKAVEKMLKAGNLKKGQKVYDIGCGDGRIVHHAAKEYGVDAIGFELSPFVFALAKIRTWLWRSKAKVRFRNFKKQNLSDADVIFCYLLPETLTLLTAKLEKEMKPGAKLISYAFPAKPWQELQRLERDPANRIGPVWIYEKA